MAEDALATRFSTALFGTLKAAPTVCTSVGTLISVNPKFMLALLTVLQSNECIVQVLVAFKLKLASTSKTAVLGRT
jgi:hypothetical protein